MRRQVGVEPLALFGLEFSLATATLDELERVTRAVTPAQVEGWFRAFQGTEEIAVLTTCHRVELVVLLRSPAVLAVWQAALPGDPRCWTVREGDEAVHHLFRVAAGRESLAVGEGEARRQVRAAGQHAWSRHPRPVVRGLLVEAADAAGDAAVTVPTSIASAAAERLITLLEGRPSRIVIIGSGVVGRQVAERLSTRGELVIVFHHRRPDPEFLRNTGARAVPLEQLSAELGSADVVITAAKFGGIGLSASELPRDRPLLLVDLGVPRNIDPGIRSDPLVRLMDLQDLYRMSHRPPTVDRSDLIVEERARVCAGRVNRLLLRPWVDALRRAAEQVRRAELRTAHRYLGQLDAAQERAVDRLTQRLVERLLAAPTDRIRGLPTGPEGDLRRRIALELLRPTPSGP